MQSRSLLGAFLIPILSARIRHRQHLTAQPVTQGVMGVGFIGVE